MVETRCTQCGRVNNNSPDVEHLSHGVGRAHGTEVVFCSDCSGSCNLDECVSGEPCDQCWTETVQNRCGVSVPTAQS